MASLTQDSAGYRIRFQRPGRPRKAVRLGHLGQDQAERAAHHVEVAIRAANRRQPIPVATVDWLYRVAPPALLHAMAELAVVDDRRLLWDATRAFVAEKLQTGSRQRAEAIERVVDELCRSLGKSTELEAIRIEDIRQWSEDLAERGLAPNTRATYESIARQFFLWCVAEKLLDDSPARVLQPKYHQSERLCEVPAETVWPIVEEAMRQGDEDMALALRLARWGGLRAGEILRVQIHDITPEQHRFMVRDHKRHHTGHGTRWVPIFPELRPLHEQYECRCAGAESGELLLRELGEKSTGCMNNRAKRLCEQLGIEPWPRMWQNMRATRETELMDDPRLSLKDVCKWIGNSPDVAMAHYAMVRNTTVDQVAGVAQA